jgi:diguanylate cyclase (GGDEF)-like protein/PAS domain S-box-containing protein
MIWKRMIQCSRRIRPDAAIAAAGQFRHALATASRGLSANDDISARCFSPGLPALSEQHFRYVVENLPTVVWMLAPNLSQVFYVNEAFETIWGQSRDALRADPRSFLGLIHPEDTDHVLQVYTGGKSHWDICYRVVRVDGYIRHVRDIGRAVFDEHGKLQYFTSSHVDITNETRVREEFRDLNFRLHEANLRLIESARMDSLTGCLNRGAFLEEAEKAIQIDTRYGRNSTLVFFDLNDFKQINDSFGHHVGDRALAAFADQIRQRLRSTDELGRYGGDEFIVLLRETDAAQARALVESLSPVVVDVERGQSLIVRYSAGVAPISDLESASVADWVRLADDQMYRHKQQRNSR